MTIEKFEGYEIHSAEVIPVHGKGPTWHVAHTARMSRTAWEATDAGKRWLKAKAAMGGLGFHRLTPSARTVLPCGGSALASAEGVPTVVKIPGDSEALPSDVEADLADLGWLVHLGDWIPASDGGDQAPVMFAERLGPKPSDKHMSEAADVVAWEPVPTRHSDDTFERVAVGAVRITLQTATSYGETRWYLIAARETWTPTREIQMTIACTTRPGGAAVRALAQLAEAAYEAMVESFPAGTA